MSGKCAQSARLFYIIPHIASRHAYSTHTHARTRARVRAIARTHNIQQQVLYHVVWDALVMGRALVRDGDEASRIRIATSCVREAAAVG